MPNSYGNYNETFFAQEALIILEKVMGMAGRVHRGFGTETARQGETTQIRRPSTFTAANAPSTAQDLNTEMVSVTLNKWKEVKFSLTDKDLSLNSSQIISDHIRPATVALADIIDLDLAQLYKQVPWYVPETATPSLNDVATVRKTMFDNKVPMRDNMLNLMISGTTELEYLKAMAAAGQDSNTQDPSLREGSIGRLFGFDVWANQNTPLHTSGVSADATGATVAAYAKGVNVIGVNAMTIAGTLKAGDIFTIAGDTQQYNVAADSTADGSGVHTALQISPALKQAVLISTVVTFTLTGAAKYQNLAFHKNAFALATAPLSDMGNELGAKIAVVSDPITNISLRSRMFYVGDTSEVKVALDVLYGFVVLDPNLAVRLGDV